LYNRSRTFEGKIEVTIAADRTAVLITLSFRRFTKLKKVLEMLYIRRLPS
jgi:hypothetical protein